MYQNGQMKKLLDKIDEFNKLRNIERGVPITHLIYRMNIPIIQ